MRRKDGIGCEDLSFIVYDASSPDNDGYFKDELAKIAWLKARGFMVTETREFTDAEAVIEYRSQVASSRQSIPFDIDGLVIKDKETDMADLRRPRPERQIALKFELETAVSVLRSVEWSESGATYTPIGVVDPVRLAGTTVQRANLNNPDMIRALGLKIGSLVTIVKRGEIIPKIEGLAPPGSRSSSDVSSQNDGDGTEKDIELPETCGSCGSDLVDGGTKLYCPNTECPKRLLHRLQKWVDILDIRELGEKLLTQLFENNVRQVSDLYHLDTEKLAGYDRMGELSAAKVIRHIRTNRELSLASFIAGFDFEGVGETIMEKVVSAGFDTLEKLRNAGVNDLAGVYGLGEITARAIVEGLRETAAEMDKVLSASIISIARPLATETQPLRLYSFCFTGELSSMKRNVAEEKVKTLGASTKSSVGKDLSFLVTNDPESGSAKNKKAQSLGIPVIDEKSFLAILDDPEKTAGFKAGKIPPPENRKTAGKKTQRIIQGEFFEI
jgi:DNA ligase (NAD+)